MQQQLVLRIVIFIAMCTFLLYIYRSYSQSFPNLLFQSNTCERSLLESDNFICEPDQVWTERKNVYRDQDQANMKKPSSSIFFLTNWEPNFHCSHARRIGRMGDGGKWVCDPHRLVNDRNCLIYSAGSHGDFSFESHMKKVLPNCEIHTFDGGLYKCPENVCIFHQMMYGNGTHPKDSKTWEMIVKELGHTNRSIDIFKIDIEGSEYIFFPTIFQSPKRSFPRQILVELHPRDASGIHGFFESLRTNNYAIFNKEPNLIAGSRFFEYTFLRLNSRFFQ